MVVDHQNRLGSDDPLTSQAGMFCYETMGESKSNEATTTFLDQNPSFTCTVDSTIDSTRRATADREVSYEEFFSRPVEIFSTEWQVGSSVSVTFQPWDLYLRNKRVANRINNFRNFKGKLHVKFLLNGNQFYWGKAMASYMPWNNSPNHTSTDDWLSIIPASQRPHIWIDPTTSQGGEMVLPFFLPDDCLQLTSFNDTAQMGYFWIQSLVNLRHAQSQTRPVRITVYAWASEVELTSPTQTNMTGLTAQAGVVDEYGEGVVSKPASVVEKIAGKLSTAPMIGPYAMATQMAAGAIGNIARLFGYSRPRNIKAIDTRRVWQTGDLACTDTEDTAMTLALTAKQEVSVDPRIAGLGGQDEMDFSYLNAKPSVLTTFPWAYTDASKDPLFSIAVTPCQFNRDAYTLPPSILGTAVTPTCFTAMPFLYWRGSMTYRFQIAASGYHKGRLLLVWDPEGAEVVPEMNTVYNKIVDIAEEKDFSITIGWGNSKPGLIVDTSVVSSPLPFTIGNIHTPAIGERSNGVLTVYVMNELVSSGADTNPIEIIVQTYSNDMQYWGPRAGNIETVTYEPQAPALVSQAGVVQSDETTAAVVNAPEADANIGKVGGDSPNTVAVVCAGEAISNFRMAMKRYSTRCIRQFFQNYNAVEFLNVEWQGSAYPIYRGGTVWQQRALTTIRSFISPAYAGWRGSVRIKQIPITQ
jgi:hypothetical protein